MTRLVLIIVTTMYVEKVSASALKAAGQMQCLVFTVKTVWPVGLARKAVNNIVLDIV